MSDKERINRDGAQSEPSSAACRALVEAATRRELADNEATNRSSQKEMGGRKGPDPIRYGDWEKAGIASDF